jgi:hypothetical protein
MSEFSIFAEIISKSVKKNGKDKVLTLGHLENLLKMASDINDKELIRHEKILDEAYNDAMHDHWGDS